MRFEAGAYLFAAGSAAIVAYAGYLRYRAKVTWGWRPVDGRITWSGTEERTITRRGIIGRKRVTLFRADIRYVYTVHGTDFEGSRIFFGDDEWHESHDPVSEITGRYPPGRVVRVFCDPKNSAKAVLERGQQAGARRYLMLVFKTAAAAAALGLLSRWMD